MKISLKIVGIGPLKDFINYCYNSFSLNILVSPIKDYLISGFLLLKAADYFSLDLKLINTKDEHIERRKCQEHQSGPSLPGWNSHPSELHKSLVCSFLEPFLIYLTRGSSLGVWLRN